MCRTIPTLGAVVDLFFQSVQRIEPCEFHLCTIGAGRLWCGPRLEHAGAVQFPRLHPDLQPRPTSRLHRLGFLRQNAADCLFDRLVCSCGDSTGATTPILGDDEIYLCRALLPGRCPRRIHRRLSDVVGTNRAGPRLCHHLFLYCDLGDSVAALWPGRKWRDHGRIVVGAQRGTAACCNSATLAEILADPATSL